MNIVHVHHTFYPVLGGLERVVQRLAEEQARLGHEVHVITSTYGAYDKPREELLNSIYIHRIKAWKLGYLDTMLPKEKEIPKEVLKQADVVHIHSQNSLFNVRIAERAKYYGTKVVVCFMAVDALLTHPNPLKRVLSFQYQKALTRKALTIADLKLVKSLRDQQVLKRRYSVNPVYIPDGIDEEYLKKPKDPNKFRRRFHIREDERVYLYIGRLHSAKGPQVLIKAASFLYRNAKKFRVVLVGPGPKGWLMKLAKKLGIEQHVVITGPVTEDLKISAIDASTCVVVPSLYDYVEVFSLVTSEAWARGKPVIASAVGELPYRIKYGENGLLVPPNDPKALTKALIEVERCNLKPSGVKLRTWREVTRKLCSLYERELESI